MDVTCMLKSLFLVLSGVLLLNLDMKNISFVGLQFNGKTPDLHSGVEGSIPSSSIMKILIVDDQQWRHDLYEKVYIGNQIVHVYDSDSAIQQLKQQTFDLIQLDHDLADQHYKDLHGAHEKTGYDVACYIQQNPGLWNMKVVLHTLNPSGRNRMFAALSNTVDVKIIPVTQMMTGR